jgi:hypothetical protein
MCGHQLLIMPSIYFLIQSKIPYVRLRESFFTFINLLMYAYVSTPQCLSLKTILCWFQTTFRRTMLSDVGVMDYVHLSKDEENFHFKFNKCHWKFQWKFFWTSTNQYNIWFDCLILSVIIILHVTPIMIFFTFCKTSSAHDFPMMSLIWLEINFFW